VTVSSRTNLQRRPPWRPLGALLCIALAWGCGDEGDDSAETCGRTPSLTYVNFGKGYLAKHCVGCHSSLNPNGHRKGAPLGVDLDTYELVLDWAERIEVRSLGDSPGMPPGGGPSEEERARLEEWLTCTVVPESRGAR
jgi:uncharacterized membrane protein